MWYPERAVIKVLTREDAQRLGTFCAQLGFVRTSTIVDEWEEAGEETCFDYECEDRKSIHRPRLLHTTQDWYYDARENCVDDMDKVPDEYFMITVDEFMGICCGDEDDVDLIVEIDSLL